MKSHSHCFDGRDYHHDRAGLDRDWGYSSAVEHSCWDFDGYQRAILSDSENSDGGHVDCHDLSEVDRCGSVE